MHESSILIKKDLSITLAPSWPRASAFVSYCRRRCALPGQGEREPARRKLKSLDHEQGRDLNEMEMNLAAARAFGLQESVRRTHFEMSSTAVMAPSTAHSMKAALDAQARDHLFRS